jgi:hypothetical protein
MKKNVKCELAPRHNILRKEKTGECYMSKDSHYYLVRDNDVLHVTDNCINTLYDNYITSSIVTFGEEYIKIDYSLFKNRLHNAIYLLDFPCSYLSKR